MPINFLGKILFPRQPDWRRKRQVKTMLWVVVSAVFFAAIVAGFILLTASQKHL